MNSTRSTSAGTSTLQPPVVTTRGLSKNFGRVTALAGVDLTLHQGRVYAVTGHNGAGKTTLLRLIAGLARPTSGAVELFGAANDDGPTQGQRRRIGALIGKPPLLESLTAVENLRFHKLLHGIAHTGSEDDLLVKVGLQDAATGGSNASKKVHHYSLGYKQRLGIAATLIHNPRLLLLDEPLNGLDPLSVAEIRSLIRSLTRDRNLSVVVAGHDLHELFQTATDFVILQAGRVHRVLTHAEVVAATGQHLRIAAPDPAAVVRVLQEDLGINNYRVQPDGSVHVRLSGSAASPDTNATTTASTPEAAEIVEAAEAVTTEPVLRALTAHEIWPTSFTVDGGDLQNLLLSPDPTPATNDSDRRSS